MLKSDPTLKTQSKCHLLHVPIAISLFICMWQELVSVFVIIERALNLEPWGSEMLYKIITLRFICFKI